MATVAILVIVGIFAIVCAAMDFDWFIENRKAQIFLRMFGRNGTRIFYIVLGLFIIACAVLAYVNGQV